MEFRVLAVGDVVGERGLSFIQKHLNRLKSLHGADFAVVNGENVAGVGIMPQQAWSLYDAGADVVTLGNHTWNKMQIVDTLQECTWLLRPANFTNLAPGHGVGIYLMPNGLRVGVMNLIGRCELDFNADSPFAVADYYLEQEEADLWLVDFHAEATSEKGAMAYHLEGRVQALWGTHTHVPTADTQILEGGLGFVTDLGMTGPIRSVLGVRPEQSLSRFLGGLPKRYETASGPCKLNGVLFTIDTQSKRCIGVERVDIFE